MSGVQQTLGFLPIYLVACSGLGVCLDFVQTGRTSAGFPGLEAGWVLLSCITSKHIYKYCT